MESASLNSLYESTRDWLECVLDAYRPELRAVAFPFFVHCYLELVESGKLKQAASFLQNFGDEHTCFHRNEVNLLGQVTVPSQLTLHEYAVRVRTRRFELALSAQSRMLLLRYLQQLSCKPLLRMFNAHVTLRVHRIAPAPVEIKDASGVDAGVAASAATQSWLCLGAERVRQVNSETLQWGAPRTRVDTHVEIAVALGLLPPDGEMAAGVDLCGQEGGGEESCRGRGAGKKPNRGGEKDCAHEADAASLATPVTTAHLPVPRLSEKVEKDILRGGRKRLARADGALPSALLTWVDAICDLCCAAASHDGAVIACGFSDGMLHLALLKEMPRANLAKMKKPAAATAATVITNAPPPAGIAAAAADDATLATLPTDGDPAPATMNATAAAAAATLAGATAADAVANEWDAATGASAVSFAANDGTPCQLVLLRGHSGPVYGASFSRDDHYVISCSQDGTARLWGVLQRACLVCYSAHASPIWSVAFAALGPYFATCGYDRSLRVWRVDKNQPIRMLCNHLGDVRCCAFHPNPSLLASGSDDAAVRVWDVQAAKCVRLLCQHGHASAVGCIDFAQGGLTLASGDDEGMLLIWHLPTARLIRRLQAHAAPLWSVAFSHEGAHIATSAGDCTLSVWGLNAAAAAVGANSVGTSLLLSRLHTKSTSVVCARYTRTNVLLATGAFTA